MSQRISQFMEKITSDRQKVHPFYLFEPWDVQARSEEVHEMAKNDGVDLRSPEVVSIIKDAPHPFQTGYIFDNSNLAAMFASNQSGKTYAEIVDDIIMLTGELPYSFRYAKGEPTPYKREVSENNVKRFGRFITSTGDFIDNKWDRPEEGWDCGYIVGAGHYPKEKIAPHNSKIWIVTSKQIRDETWWPAMKFMVPPDLIDRTKATNGFDNREFIIHMARNSKLNLKTYEQKADRLEGSGQTQEYEKLHKITFDEEPPDQKFLSVAMIRCAMVRLVTTPYKGLSWTYDRLFKKGINVYHCTQYDCPYHKWKDIDNRKRFMPKWEIGARIYGLHTGQSGRPYYEGLLDITAKYLREFSSPKSMYKLYSAMPWDSVQELIGQDIVELESEEGERDAWEVYEERREDGIYFIGVDTAEGSKETEERTDANVAHVFRFPDKDEPWPIHVASLRTTLPTDEFARLVLYGCIYWNYAMMIPEAVGKSSGTFIAEIRDYPFIFTMNVINDRTRKQTERLGFFTTVKTRIMLFDLVGSMIKDRAEIPAYGIRSYQTLKEIGELVVGKNGRPDHARNGSSDSLVAFAIGLYAFTHCKEMLKTSVGFMKKKKKVDNFFTATQKESRPLLGCRAGGMDGLDPRSQYGKNNFRQPLGRR
jgi:hypothetical protein